MTSETGHYIVNAHRPGAVITCLKSNFLSKDSDNCVIVKSNRIEVRSVENRLLPLKLEIPIQGRILFVMNIQTHHQTNDQTNVLSDVLFLVTHNYDYAALKYSGSKVKTLAKGSLKDSIGRECECGLKVTYSRDNCIAVHLYDGFVKIFPLQKKKFFGEPFNVRLEERMVLDMCFLSSPSENNNPELLLLHQDSRGLHHVISHSVDLRQKEFQEGNTKKSRVDGGSGLLIVISNSEVLVLGQRSITYIGRDKSTVMDVEATIFQSFCLFANEVLIGDEQGYLFSLSYMPKLELKNLGVTSISSGLVVMDEYVFVGSTFGNSQLLLLKTMEVMEEYSNLGPIVDFDVIETRQNSPNQIITCSGASKDASLRLITNGIKIEDVASVELTAIRGMWNLRANPNDEFDTYLVQSFLNETRVLGFLGEEMEEVCIKGLDAHSSSLFVASLVNFIVQVTPRQVRLINLETCDIIHVWEHPEKITVANGYRDLLVVSLRGGLLVFLKIENNTLMQVDHKQLATEVSCIGLYENYVAVGLWEDFSVLLYYQKEQVKIDLGGDTQARSIVFCTFHSNTLFLLVGMGDGNLIQFQISNGKAFHKKKVCIGTQSILLRVFENHDTCSVFATGDQPKIIFSKGSTNPKISFANVNLFSHQKNQSVVNHVTQFYLKNFDSCCLCLADETSLRVGILDDIQKLHVQTFFFKGLAPRRIAYHDTANSFVVGCIQTENTLCNSLLCLDDTTMEVWFQFDLDPNEILLSLISVDLKNYHDNAFAPYIVVGTAYTYADEDEPTSGRLLIFKTHLKTFQQVTEHTTRGGVYSLCGFQDGTLLACVNSKTNLYKFYENQSVAELQPESGASHHGHILSQFVKSNKNLAIVGDLMRSISVLQYSSQHHILEEIARDYNANWTTAVEMLTHDLYIGSENWNNLFVLKRNTNPQAPEEITCRLVTQGEFHLGEMVNKFLKGTLIIPTSTYVPLGSQTLFATVDGSIGIILGLQSQCFKFLKNLEISMSNALEFVGDFQQQQYRSFNAGPRKKPSRGFIDGDFVESFLDLSLEEQNNVVQYLNKEFHTDMKDEDDEMLDGKPHTVDYVISRVEEMSRLH